MDKANNTPLQFGIDFNKKYITVIDCPTERDPMSGFLRDLNINFNFLPFSHPKHSYHDHNPANYDIRPKTSTGEPLLNYIMNQYGRDKTKTLLLVLSYPTLKRLLTEKSLFNLEKLLQKRKIKALLYANSEMIPEFYDDENNLSKINQFKIFVLCNGEPGKRLQSILSNFTFVSHFYMDNLLTETRFGALNKQDSKKTKTFLTYLQHNRNRLSRRFLEDEMRKNVNIDSGILKSHNDLKNSKKIFKDLEESYGSHSVTSTVPDVLDKFPAIKDYNETCFEIVDEGLDLELVKDDDAFHFCEKLVKPITMRHPFILISSRNSMKKLEQFGFKTFGDFIDESYDACETYQNRIMKVIEVIKNFDLEKSQKFYNDTRAICEHNLHHLLQTGGMQQYKNYKNWKNVLETLLYE